MWVCDRGEERRNEEMGERKEVGKTDSIGHLGRS